MKIAFILFVIAFGLYLLVVIPELIYEIMQKIQSRRLNNSFRGMPRYEHVDHMDLSNKEEKVFEKKEDIYEALNIGRNRTEDR